jgi:hypothetical protein
MSYEGKNNSPMCSSTLMDLKSTENKKKKKAVTNYCACQRPMQNDPNKIRHYFLGGPFQL